MYARDFLKKFLCDGIHVYYTHYYILGYIYKIVEELINFINSDEMDNFDRYLFGNYESTLFRVTKEN